MNVFSLKGRKEVAKNWQWWMYRFTAQEPRHLRARQEATCECNQWGLQSRKQRLQSWVKVKVSFNNEIWVHNGPYHKPPEITMCICTSSLHTSGYFRWHAKVIEDVQGIYAGSCCGIKIDGDYTWWAYLHLHMHSWRNGSTLPEYWRASPQLLGSNKQIYHQSFHQVQFGRSHQPKTWSNKPSDHCTQLWVPHYRSTPQNWESQLAEFGSACDLPHFLTTTWAPMAPMRGRRKKVGADKET